MPKRQKTLSIDINLVPKDPFFESPLGRVMRWALSAGRYLVIFTELVVILSFASRFTLDRQITDLNSAIYRKVSIIESYGDLENSVRTAQERLSDYKTAEQQTNIADTFASLTKVTPNDVTLDRLSINPTSIVVSGTVPSQAAFNVFINNLQLSSEFSELSVDRIEASKENGGYDFRLRANTKGALTVKTTKTETPSKANSAKPKTPDSELTP